MLIGCYRQRRRILRIPTKPSTTFLQVFPGQCLIVTLQETGTVQPLLVWVVLEHQLPAFEVVHHTLNDLVIDRRAAMAATYTAVLADPVFIHIVCAMNNDGALPGKIVDARFQTIQPE